jgi:hypothetical protein
MHAVRAAADPAKRINIKDLQDHPWYMKDLPPGVKEMNDNMRMPPAGSQVPRCCLLRPAVLRSPGVPCASLGPPPPLLGGRTLVCCCCRGCQNPRLACLLFCLPVTWARLMWGCGPERRLTCAQSCLAVLFSFWCRQKTRSDGWCRRRRRAPRSHHQVNRCCRGRLGCLDGCAGWGIVAVMAGRCRPGALGSSLLYLAERTGGLLLLLGWAAGLCCSTIRGRIFFL